MPLLATTPRYALDIETAPLDPNTADPREGLYWPTARITTVAVYNPSVSFVIEDGDESRLIMATVDRLADLPGGIICTWNGANFDYPMLIGRSRMLNLPDWWDSIVLDPTITPKYEPQPGFEPVGHDLILSAASGQHSHLDVAYLWKEWAASNDVKWRLKDVARANGMNPIEVDREHMDRLTVAERLGYNFSDTVVTYDLAPGPDPAQLAA